MFLTKDSNPETPPIFASSFTQEKSNFIFLKIFISSFARINRLSINRERFSSILLYPIPFTPSFNEKLKLEINTVYKNIVKISLKKVIKYMYFYFFMEKIIV